MHLLKPNIYSIEREDCRKNFVQLPQSGPLDARFAFLKKKIFPPPSHCCPCRPRHRHCRPCRPWPLCSPADARAHRRAPTRARACTFSRAHTLPPLFALPMTSAVPKLDTPQPFLLTVPTLAWAWRMSKDCGNEKGGGGVVTSKGAGARW